MSKRTIEDDYGYKITEITRAVLRSIADNKMNLRRIKELDEFNHDRNVKAKAIQKSLTKDRNSYMNESTRLVNPDPNVVSRGEARIRWLFQEKDEMKKRLDKLEQSNHTHDDHNNSIPMTGGKDGVATLSLGDRVVTEITVKDDAKARYKTYNQRRSINEFGLTVYDLDDMTAQDAFGFGITAGIDHEKSNALFLKGYNEGWDKGVEDKGTEDNT